MSVKCLDPILAYYVESSDDPRFGKRVSKETGELIPDIKFLGKARDFMSCMSNDKYKELIKYGQDRIYYHTYYLELPCRHCINCQLNRSREWAIRNTLEFRDHLEEKNYFLTLTYDEKHIKKNKLDMGILFKSDLQSFMKRLRKYFKNYKIRFYACGEYGSKTLRPHYHLLIYNCGDLNCQEFGNNPTNAKVKYYVSPILAKLWTNGIHIISEVNEFSIMYVSRYCTKKIDSDNFIDPKLLPPQFNTMSLKPGIAHKYYIDHKDDIYENDSFIYHFDDKSLQLKPLKYFDRQYDKESPVLFQLLKDHRKEFARDFSFYDDLDTDLNFSDYLKNEADLIKQKLSLRRL